MAEALIDPEVTDAPPKAHTAVVEKTVGAVDLSKVNLTDVALAQFGDWRKNVSDATETLTGVQHDVSTQAKLDDAKSLRHRLINTPLAEARKVSKALKSKLTAVSGEVGVELARIEASYTDAAKLITPQIEAGEAKLAAEKAERDRLAAERREKFEAAIAKIRGQATAAKGLPAARIADGIKGVEALAFGDEWAEFAPLAAQAQAETLTALRALLAETQAAEAAAAAAEALRIENERKAAELAEERRKLALQQSRMEDIRRLNAQVSDAQAAIVGKTAAESVTALETFVSATSTRDVSEAAFGDLAPMAVMAQSMVLTQLRSMLDAARFAVAAEAEEIARTEAAAAQAEADRQAAELAAADAAAEALRVAAAPTPADIPNADMMDDTAEFASMQPLAEILPAALAHIIAPVEPAQEYTEGRDSRQVLKAEGASPDATDRETPAAASPGVGPMGAGQPADAGPLAGTEFTAAVVEAAQAMAGPFLDLQPVDEPGAGFTSDAVADLLAHIQKIDEMPFPSHPKPPKSWFDRLRALAKEVGA